ncbi:PREDICTED: uncharacterized protein LOC109220021 [Nicotiana attenuata]|uniref:uncharacterized protein LOC109220021 n=1 Tax=Nicotiana attenuata TaxID=49451 RepID=UPI000904DE15|nr:PREDICTED: uncharacterized protein LOC109220021 [Nicotiana attenuata]
MANFTPIGESHSSLFPKLVQMGLLQPVRQTRQNPASPAYRAGTRCAYHSGAEGHDTNDCWTLKRAVENLIEQKLIVLKDEDVPNDKPTIHYRLTTTGCRCGKEAEGYRKTRQGGEEDKPTPQNTKKKEEAKVEATPSKHVVLYVPRGHKKELMSLSLPRRFELNKGSKMCVPKGTYVVRGPVISPTLNEPVVIGRALERPMTDPTAIPWNYNKAVVTYRGKEISGEVKENNPAEKYLNLEEVNNATRKRFPRKKPVSAEEAEEFFRKMKMADYEIIDQLWKSPSQVSLLSLLMNSTEHQKVLIKTLNEAYLPIETTVEQLERMAERFFAVNQISFSKNDLPPEGAAHNKALHLRVKCEGYYVKRVMLDGGSGVDICPLSTLQRMKIGTERIRPNNVCVRAFDGIKRDTIGEIDLILTIGPVDFEVTFQVLDMDTSYNFLLGRPWIHAAGAIPSTLH